MSNKLTNRTSENLPNVLSSKNITQNGKTNAVIQHAETVNINVHPSINPPTGLNTMFGDLKISDNDAKLLAEFKNDYKNILKYCIRIDPTGEAFDIHCLELIDLNYTRWQFDWRDFESEKIREIVYHTLKNFNEYLDYLSDQYMIPLLANPNFVIYKNQSREDGERLREVIIPNTIRIRKELRDRYLELWPVKEPIVR
nr:MAG TPA: hypothetical protein [Caudoviricetes sp.]